MAELGSSRYIRTYPVVEVATNSDFAPTDYRCDKYTVPQADGEGYQDSTGMKDARVLSRIEAPNSSSSKEVVYAANTMSTVRQVVVINHDDTNRIDVEFTAKYGTVAADTITVPPGGWVCLADIDETADVSIGSLHAVNDAYCTVIILGAE